MAAENWPACPCLSLPKRYNGPTLVLVAEILCRWVPKRVFGVRLPENSNYVRGHGRRVGERGSGEHFHLVAGAQLEQLCPQHVHRHLQLSIGEGLTGDPTGVGPPSLDQLDAIGPEPSKVLYAPSGPEVIVQFQLGVTLKKEGRGLE